MVGNIYIRKVEKKGGKYVNAVVKTYPNVSQFWTYNKEEFLKNPVYSRDYPPAKNLEVTADVIPSATSPAAESRAERAALRSSLAPLAPGLARAHHASRNDGIARCSSGSSRR